jgi:hypothetical protein
MLLYARLRGHVSASGPVVPFFGKRDVPFHRRRRADWLDAVKVGRTFGTTGPLLLLSVNGLWRRRFGRNRSISHCLGIFIHTAAVISSLKEGRQTASEIHPLPCGLNLGA